MLAEFRHSTVSIYEPPASLLDLDTLNGMGSILHASSIKYTFPGQLLLTLC